MQSWARLAKSKRSAATYLFDILICGPAPSDTIEYRKRVEMRAELEVAGQNAAFGKIEHPGGCYVRRPSSKTW
jgi:hypothetical protein